MTKNCHPAGVLLLAWLAPHYARSPGVEGSLHNECGVALLWHHILLADMKAY